MRPRQHANLTDNVAKLAGVSAINPLAFEDQVADHAFFQVLEGADDLAWRVVAIAVLGEELGEDPLAQLAYLVGPRVLARGLLAFEQLIVEALAKHLGQRIDHGRGRRLRRSRHRGA